MSRRGRLGTLRITFFCCAILAWLATTGQASVIDAPHNETNGVFCASCHTYSFWWRYSPAQRDAGFVSNVEVLCKDCHKAGGTGPRVETHSSVSTHSTRPAWDRACLDCHNPHDQEQLHWGAESFVVTGTITGVTVAYNSTSNETTISYANAVANANWPNWPAVGTTESPRDWANKSVTNPGRGLILAQDTNVSATTFASNTFPIVAATATEITVKGEITENMINTTYTDPVTHKTNSLTCNTFGLIYGNLIRSAIKVNSVDKPVKFFDPEGGSISREENGNPTGVCQVCHTDANHYKNDGVLPSGQDTHAARSGRNCIICHKHVDGFQGKGHDVADFGWGTGNCATCHNPTGAAVNIVNTIHKGQCGLCHVDAGGGGTLREGDATFGIDGSALNGHLTSTCLDCHTPTAPTIHHVSASGFAAAGACTECHANETGKKAAAHDSKVVGVAECTLCHTATAGLSTGIPLSATDHKVHDSCLTCHDTNGTLRAPTGKAVAMPTGGGTCLVCHVDQTQTAGAIHHASTSGYAAAGDCIQCHADEPGKLVAAHDTRVIGVAECTLCHTATAGLSNGMPVSDADQKVHDACLTCHNTNGTLKAPGGKAVAMPAGGGTCLACHIDQSQTAPAIHHASASGYAANGECSQCHADEPGKKVAPHDAIIGGVAECVVCHSATVGLATGMPVSITDNKMHDTCLTCHNTDGALRPPAGKAVALPAGGGTCLTCHIDPSQTVGDIHHASTSGYAVAGDCIQCHADEPGKLVAPHDTRVVNVQGCSLCHTATEGLATGVPVSTTDNKVHDACLTCHNTNGTLRAPGGKAVAMPAGGGACTDCHGLDYFTNHDNIDSKHNTFLLKASTPCESCHNQSGDPATNVVGTIHRGECTNCHAATDHALVNGTTLGLAYGGVDYMIGDARKHTLGTTSACTVCHVTGIHPYMTTKNTHPETNRTHYTMVLSEPACLGMCHVAELQPFTGFGEVHPRECATCHNNGNYDYSLKDSAANHTIGQPSTCTGCHLLTGAFPRHDLSGVAVTTDPAIVGGVVASTFTLSTTFTSASSDIASCMATKDGSTWTPAIVSGSSPTFTCTASYTGLANGPVTLNMKATSAAGAVIVADPVAATVGP